MNIKGHVGHDEVGDGPPRNAALDVKGDNWPWRFTLPDLNASGVFTGSLAAQIVDGALTTEGDAAVLNLVAAGDKLSGDELRQDKIAVGWKVEGRDGSYKADRFTLDAPVATLSASGVFPPAADQQAKVEGRVDLAALAGSASPHAPASGRPEARQGDDRGPRRSEGPIGRGDQGQGAGPADQRHGEDRRAGRDQGGPGDHLERPRDARRPARPLGRQPGPRPARRQDAVPDRHGAGGRRSRHRRDRDVRPRRRPRTAPRLGRSRRRRDGRAGDACTPGTSARRPSTSSRPTPR